MKFIQAAHYTKGRIKKIRLIVVHDTEFLEVKDSALQVANFFAGIGTTAPQASAHFSVDDTQVIQCVKVTDTAWHCPNANADGIGVEHAGKASQNLARWTDVYSRKVLLRSAKLVAPLCIKYGISPVHLSDAQILDGKTKGFIGHRDASRAFKTPGGHTDPGPDFPWAAYLLMVRIEIDALQGKPWSTTKAKAAIAALALSAAAAAAIAAGLTLAPTPPPPAPTPVVTPIVIDPTPTPTPSVVPSSSPDPSPSATPTPSVDPTNPAPAITCPPVTVITNLKVIQLVPITTPWGQGDSGATVRAIQRGLNVGVTGTYDTATINAVKALQRTHNLAVDGVVGKYTTRLIPGLWWAG